MLRFPTINDREEVAVWAYDVIDGSGEYPASAIVLSSPSGGLESLVRTGDPVSGGPTFDYVSGYPDLNNSGEVAFRARMSDNRDGIFVASTTGVVEVIRDGEPAPTGGNIHYLGNAPAINDDGEVAFYAQNDDSPRIGGLFVKGASGIRTIVAEGVSVPGDSVEFSSIDPNFQFNNEGSVAFYSTLSGTPDAGIFIGDGSALTPVALLGDSLTGGGTISELRDPGFNLNNSSQVAFWTRISGVTGVTSGFYLWSPSAGPPEPRLLEGQALPGGGTAGLVGWGGFGAYMVLADSGEMAMLLENVTGSPDLPRVVIADKKGKLRKFLTGGEPAPGVPGTLARFYPLLEVNRAGRFFTQAYLLGGTAKAAIYRDLPAKKP